MSALTFAGAARRFRNYFKSFFFPGKNGIPRDLNYSSYYIAPIPESLKFSEG